MRYPDFDGSEPCRQIDPDLFYPSSWNLTLMHRMVMQSVCESCPSKQPCLEWSLHHEDEGWWAGTTPVQRRQLRRSMGVRLQIPTLPIADRRGAA